jgi:diguanylate cyclase (GGDEF)-like protein/PAS domain S-box-containing protein
MGLIEETSQLFQATFEQAAVGIAHVAPTGQFIRLNRRFCEIAGYPHDELMQRTFQDITHPDDLQRDLGYLHQLLAGEIDTYDMEKRYFRKDGSLVWVNLTVSLVRHTNGAPKYFISVIVDISDRKRSELELQTAMTALAETQELYASVFSSISDAVFLTDDSGKFAFVCPNVTNIFGRSDAEVWELGNIRNILGQDFIDALNVGQIQANGELTNQDCQVWDVEGQVHHLLVNIKSVHVGHGTLLFTCRDISDRKQTETELKLYESIANTTQDLMAFVDRDYRYRMVNDAYAERFDQSQASILGQAKAAIIGQTPDHTLGSQTFQQIVKPHLDRCFAGEVVHYQSWFDFADQQPHYLDVLYSPYQDEHDMVTGVVVSIRDITSLHRAKLVLDLKAQRAKALLELPQASETMSEQEFLQYGQAIAENLTESQISFVHFVNDDEQTIELVTWSQRTLEHYCHAVVDRHYPVAQAGIWADALRQRQPIIFNNYEQYPHKHGLPEGHAILHRLISAPVMDNGKVVMLAGVGNKASDYTELDVETVQLIANELWRIAQSNRTLSKLADLNRELEERVAQRTLELQEQILQRKASETRYHQVLAKMSDGVAIYEAVDEGSDFILKELNPSAERILNLTLAEVRGQSVSEIFPEATVREHCEVFQRVWQSHQPEHFSAEQHPNNRITLWTEHYIFRLSNRELVAVFQDVTARKRAEEQLQQIAHYDALTELPNRVLLGDRLTEAMLQTQHSQRTLAIVYLDLDGFKVVNDTYGHKVGDQLLKVVAKRMQNALRQRDTIARIGGDEFVAVLVDIEQTDIDDLLLTRLLNAAAQPVQIGDWTIQVSASLGVTFYPQPDVINADQLSADLLLRQADQAMYQAKLSGKNRYHLFQPEKL